MVEAELRRQVTAQVVQDGIGLRHQPAEDLAAFLGLQVQRQRALVAVERVEELARAVLQEMRADAAGHVAAVGGVLDLDHLGAQIGQQHGAERPGAVLLDGEDGDAGEGEISRHDRSSFAP